jgi:glycosyltransferase involved in cell wall biosynthesis/SAM-dependent methyltransferase
MPPSKSGIADYSSALVEEIGKRAQVKVYSSAEQRFDPCEDDIALYHLGNNPYHDFCYETALRHPGVVVMHEANLHHLIANLTIKKGDWVAYLAECELNGGPEALAFARRVRRLEVGPDYEGLAMTRRVLDASRGVIVHSHFVARETRAQGFDGPIAVIPHGAWIPKTDRLATRYMLGVDEATPLIGAFGYLKPYKRIAESLRALKRLVRLDPRVKMILVGEPHPDFPVDQLIRTLGLRDHVRIVGFVPIEEFVNYMDACDIVLNLRFPTVGETSGSLQRALGLGKAVVVSDIGSFAELPDDVCLKVPIGPNEEDLIFEYLNTLVSRPDLAKAMGARAKEWVATECNWGVVADRYVAFLDQVRRGEFVESAAPSRAAETVAENVTPEAYAVREEPRTGAPPGTAVAPYADEAPAPMPDPEAKPQITPEVVSTWLQPDNKEYAEIHKTRFVHTLEITPLGDESKSILEMGAYMQMTPALRYTLGYGYVRGCYYGVPGRIDHKTVTSDSGEVFECDVDHFDAEKHVYPYADEAFDTVMCCELIEHLFEDPMHMMSEINRILKPGGHLVMTTPNAGSLRAISAILLGYHPAFFPAYIRPRKPDEEAEARHNREYVPMEIQHLLTDSGFELVRLETGEFREEPHPELGWVTHMLERYSLSHTLRGDGIYAVGRKTGPIRSRWPGWLYV